MNDKTTKSSMHTKPSTSYCVWCVSLSLPATKPGWFSVFKYLHFKAQVMGRISACGLVVRKTKWRSY